MYIIIIAYNTFISHTCLLLLKNVTRGVHVEMNDQTQTI